MVKNFCASMDLSFMGKELNLDIKINATCFVFVQIYFVNFIVPIRGIDPY